MWECGGWMCEWMDGLKAVLGIVYSNKKEREIEAGGERARHRERHVDKRGGTKITSSKSFFLLRKVFFPDITVVFQQRPSFQFSPIFCCN